MVTVYPASSSSALYISCMIAISVKLAPPTVRSPDAPPSSPPVSASPSSSSSPPHAPRASIRPSPAASAAYVRRLAIKLHRLPARRLLCPGPARCQPACPASAAPWAALAVNSELLPTDRLFPNRDHD